MRAPATPTFTPATTPAPQPTAPAAPAEGMTEQMATLINMNWPSKRKQFNPSKFLGEGNIELFRTQFRDVSAANGLEKADHFLIIMRFCLGGGATTYGSEESIDEVRSTLRTKYRITHD